MTSTVLSTAMSMTTAAAASLITPQLTTTFVPKAAICTGNHLTMLANRKFEIWLNVPVPVPGTTITDCYPDQFMQSFLSAAGGVTQPAFEPLVCPQSYSQIGPYTSNYIACCPSGYGFAQPSVTPFTDRPAYGGTCYTNIAMATPVKVVAYGSSGITATTTFSATNTLAQAYAYPYEGTAFGVGEVPSITVAPSSSATSKPATTYTILAAAGPTFIPNSINAKIGDKLNFEFSSGNHSITQSTFDSPCSPLINGFDSGNMGSTAAEVSVTVNVSTAQFFYSRQGSDCREGMSFVLNPTTAQSADKFHIAAMAQYSTPSTNGISVGAKAGIAIASIAVVGLLLLLALFFLKRRKIYAADSENATIHKDGKHYPPPKRALTSTSSPYLSSAKEKLHGACEFSPAGTSSSQSVFSDISPPLPPPPPPPPKGDAEELHGNSSPTELATQHNQHPTAELQGSDGTQFVMSEKEVESDQRHMSFATTPTTSSSTMIPRRPFDLISHQKEEYESRNWDTSGARAWEESETYSEDKSQDTLRNGYPESQLYISAPRYESGTPYI